MDKECRIICDFYKKLNEENTDEFVSFEATVNGVFVVLIYGGTGKSTYREYKKFCWFPLKVVTNVDGIKTTKIRWMTFANVKEILLHGIENSEWKIIEILD